MVDAPMAAESSVRSPVARPACPRCGAPITGDYKFCPSCAARLKVGAGDEEILLPERARWKTVLLVGVAGVLVSALTLVGVYLFHPDWFQRPALETPPPAPEAAVGEYETPAFDVARLASDLVEIPGNRFAFRVSIDSVAIREEDREKILQRDPNVESVDANVWYPMRISRYETTRGQYDAFLRDVYAHPERLPEQWRNEMAYEASLPQPPSDRSPEAFILRQHVPLSWAVLDERTKDRTVVGWTVADRDRNLPMSEVSFNEATAFCQWAGERIGVKLRLPYRMEWVRAARGGTATPRIFPWGDAPLIYACNNLGNFARPQFVQFAYSAPAGGSGGATPEGLYAMAGNVAELTLDHAFSLADIPQPGQSPAPELHWVPLPTTTRNPAVACGGSYKSGIDDCQVESTSRNLSGADATHEDIGFRVMAEPTE